jgi:hypothetical protein
MVWGFEIEGEGEEIDTLEYRGGILVHPPRFGVVFKARSGIHRVVSEREEEKVRVFMGGFEKFD